nr:PREDICTED: probable cation-transporting ATPase 13A4 [Latimeria chalumnae]|eukprot:XP_014344016.1 PREDICTED: probable cation-transporting ATPase 13A4 [Latimeria chalumnae]
MGSDSSKLLGDQQSCYGSLQQQLETRNRMEITGYQRVLWRVVLCHVFSVLTVGLLILIFHWKPVLEVLAKCRPCSLHQADWVIIKVSKWVLFFLYCIL